MSSLLCGMGPWGCEVPKSCKVTAAPSQNLSVLCGVETFGSLGVRPTKPKKILKTQTGILGPSS